jgi:NADPH:quinone reductase-like Zn-dependent oxidoreductase
MTEYRVIVPRAGGYEQLQVREVAPLPPPPKAFVTIRVKAAGVQYADCLTRMGVYESAKVYVGWPITPGFEVAGEVTAIGEGVEHFKVGDTVGAVTRFGGYTTELSVPHWQVFKPPHGFDLEQTAGFAVVYLTAYYALCELARPRPGHRILVHSAAGGVGGALLQLAKHQTLEAVAVVGSARKVETAQQLGAAVVIDRSAYTTKAQMWRAIKACAPNGFGAIFDANGVDTLGDSYRHLMPTGRLVVYGFHSMLPKEGGRPNWLKLALDWLRTPRFNPLDMTGSNRSVMAFNLSYLFDRRDLLTESLSAVLAIANEGQLKPQQIRAYPLERVADAHRDLESGQTVGKLILRMP